MKLYYLYKIFFLGLAILLCNLFLYLNSYHGLSAAEIIFADAFLSNFKIVFQIPLSIITSKFGKRTSLIIGNASVVIYVLFILGCKSTYLLIISNAFMAFGFFLKVYVNQTYFMILFHLIKNKSKSFSKIEGRSSALFYIFDAIHVLLLDFYIL